MHILHLIQRRFPNRAGAITVGLLLASASALALGLGLLLLGGA